MIKPVRSALAAALLALAAPAAGVAVLPVPAFAQAPRDAGAEAFIQREAQMALATLNDRSLSPAARKAQFRAFVDRAADVPRITNFVLGKYRRQVSPAQYAQFAQAFRTYANSIYESRLGQYDGEGFKVTGSIERAPGDVVVTSQVVGGRFAKSPAVVDWRVLKGAGGQWHVVDVEVQGVWLAITQQQDFVSTLDNNRGDINVLIAQLRTAATAPATGGR